jgi:hypothetical protein
VASKLWTMAAVLALATVGIAQLTFTFTNGGAVQGNRSLVIYDAPFYLRVVPANIVTILANTTPSVGLRLFDGGVYASSSGDISGLVYRDPFYDYTPTELSYLCAVNISILYPVNRSFFMPSITPNVTYWVDGVGTGQLCQYRTNGGWNNLTCSDGNNSQLITLPEGWPITLTFRTTAGYCTAYDSQYAYVSYGGSAAPVDTSFIYLALLIPLFILIILGGKHPSQRASRRTQRA